ncbi:MAG: hypothetical protein WC943_12420 [Elusimicrobiota bacterium]|jgi:hypothetical protein
MIRFLAAAISLILAVEPAAWAAAGASSASDPAPAVESAAERSARLSSLIETLKSLTDEEYDAALQSAPAEARTPQFASRSAALRSAYGTLAGLEYSKAAQAAPEETKARYADAQERVAGPDGARLSETGAEISVLKWLANAVLNYWVSGGQTYVGRKAPAGGGTETERTLAGLSAASAEVERDPSKKAELHYKRGALYERLSQAPEGPDPEAEKLALKTARLQKLADLLASISDDEYRQALESAPGASKQPGLASRSKALHSAYATLAALEYRQAVKTAAGPDAERYSAAYNRVTRGSADALTVDPVTLQETGLAGDLFKFLGNAVLNYWLHGGEDYIARGWKGKGGSAASSAAVEEASASLPPAAAAERHFARGSAYEGLAEAALKADLPEDRAAVQAQRLRMLASLLESVSDEEFSEVRRALPPDAPAQSLPASRSQALKGVYATLAALEYRAASEAAPKKETFTADLERVSKTRGKDIGVDPSTLQETGWGTKLLGLLALGGLGYGIYELQRRQGKPGRRTAVQPPVVTPEPEASCPEGTRLHKGECLAKGNDKLRGKADKLEKKLASASKDAEEAGLHHKLGQVYEELAAGFDIAAPEAQASIGEAQPAPEPKPVVEAKPAPAIAKAPPVPALTDILLLWDGSRLDGKVTAATQDKIVFKSGNGVTGVKQESVRALILTGAAVDADAEDIRSAASQGDLPLILKADGSTARGRLATATGTKLHFKLSSGVLSLSRGEVRAIVFPAEKKGR